jgi:hypothetical protein
MANAWREHVKKTMSEMKSKAKGGKIMLKDVLKAAGKTYKKSGKAAASGGKTMKKKQKKSAKRRKSSKKR